MSTYNKEQINSAINSMTAICDKGKAEVRKPVESIIGEELETDRPPVYRAGRRYKAPGCGDAYVFSASDSFPNADRWYAVNVDEGYAYIGLRGLLKEDFDKAMWAYRYTEAK